MRQILPVSRIANPVKLTTVTPQTLSKLWELRLLLEQETAARKAVGVAAPQLAIQERVFWIAEEANKVYINPSFETEVNPAPIPEGCLSIKGTKILYVLRHSEILASYTTLEKTDSGEVKAVEVKNEPLKGLVAQAFQHELDHLQGVSIIDLAVNLSREERRLYKRRN